MDKKAVFKRFASAGSLLFGVLCGVGYIYLDLFSAPALDAQVVLAFAFVSAGLMGLSYFLHSLKGRSTAPLMVEMLKLFYSLWLLVGLVWVLRIFDAESAEIITWDKVLTDFLVGMITGTVWALSLFLFVGIRYDIASWEVLRFPSWVAMEARWVWRKLRS